MAHVDTRWRRSSPSCRWSIPAAIIAAAFLTVPFAIGSAVASDPPEWQAALGRQLRSERSCILAHLVMVREFELGSTKVVEGRVRCMDSREFDFSRSAPHNPFKLQLCQPSYC